MSTVLSKKTPHEKQNGLTHGILSLVAYRGPAYNMNHNLAKGWINVSRRSMIGSNHHIHVPPLVTTRPIPYLHQTSSVLRKSPLELLSVLLE